MRLAVALLLAAPAAAASAAAPPTVSQKEIGGAVLGKGRAYYRSLYGPPSRLDRGGGIDRLSFPRLKLHVVLSSKANAAIGIATWNIRFRTRARVGPCSRVSELRKAYGAQLEPLRAGGRLLAYRLGRLFFSVTPTLRVGSVHLTPRRSGVHALLRSPACSPGA